MTSPDTTAEAERPLRRDAARNRALILQTAAQVFAEHGLDAGYDEIARRAGIGVGTVYRRFPEREGLVEALFEAQIEEVVVFAEQAMDLPDPWTGLTWFLERTLEKQVCDRGLKEVMFSTVSPEVHRRLGRDRIGPLLVALVERAKAAGEIRADVEAADLGVPLMVLSSMTTPAQPDLWRRYLVLFLDGLRPRTDQVALPHGPPDDDTLHEVMRQLHGR